MENLIEKLDVVYHRWLEIGEQINNPEVMSDMKRYVKLTKDYKDLEPIIEAYKTYKNLLTNIENAKVILAEEKDEDYREMAKEELADSNAQIVQLEEDIRLMLIPSDPQDNKNAVIELRAGTGGDEASLFAGDLYRMYVRFCERLNWKIEVVSVTEGTLGGYKEVIFNVIGNKAYGILKYESGVHRVQRVPQTETQGRVHTSAASVAILPEADEFDVDIKLSDIRRDTYCSSGPGGQSVNTTYSAVRLTHMPSGIVVAIQDEKSQLKNHDKAMKILRNRIFELEHQKYLDEISSQRKTMVCSGDRSAKVRTYNYPQNRVTDHRINFTMYNLTGYMDGDIMGLIEALQMAENAEKLKDAVS